MRAQQYLQNIPESLEKVDITEAWGNRLLKEWFKTNIPIDSDKILWGRVMNSKREREP